MTIRADLERLDPLAKIEMFVLDTTPIGIIQDPLRWHPGTTIEGNAITWQGEQYEPFPIRAEGFELNTSGTLPRPTFTASNIGGFLGAFLRTMGDGLGATITRKRTLAKYLDGQPAADPLAAFPDELYTIARKVGSNAITVTLECAVAFDVAGVQLPRRQVIAGTCTWLYRGPFCGYAGPPVQDITGQPTASLAADRCRKTLDACRARFGAAGVLPTSAFPASLLVRSS